jgi:hypothetical protein
MLCLCSWPVTIRKVRWGFQLERRVGFFSKTLPTTVSESGGSDTQGVYSLHDVSKGGDAGADQLPKRLNDQMG